MRKTDRWLVIVVLAAVTSLACGGSSGECSPACGPCLACYHGNCVPFGACDAGADGSGDVGPDGEPDGRHDVPEDASADTDLPVEAEAEAEAEAAADAATDAESGTPCRPLGGRCPDGQVCDLPGCALIGLEGFCVPRPTSCPETWEPVCGCDSVTYSNDCERLLAGEGVDRVGECRVFPPPTCRADIFGFYGWYAADGTFICGSDCWSCTAECDHYLAGVDAWFAVCSDETNTGCGEHIAPLLIVRTDCS